MKQQPCMYVCMYVCSTTFDIHLYCSSYCLFRLLLCSAGVSGGQVFLCSHVSPQDTHSIYIMSLKVYPVWYFLAPLSTLHPCVVTTFCIGRIAPTLCNALTAYWLGLYVVCTITLTLTLTLKHTHTHFVCLPCALLTTCVCNDRYCVVAVVCCRVTLRSNCAYRCVHNAHSSEG